MTNYAIIPRVGEPIERTLQRFKKGALMAGIFREMKERTSYTKPSQRRRAPRRVVRREARAAEAQPLEEVIRTMAKHKPKHPTKKTAPKAKYVTPIAQRGITAPTPALTSEQARRQLRGF